MMRSSRVAAVAKFEFLAVVKRWSYLLTTFGLPLFLGFISATVLGVQTYFLAQRLAESADFALVDEAGVIDPSVFEERDGAKVWETRAVVVRLYDSVEAPTAELEAGRIRALYVISPDYLETGKVAALQSEKSPLLSMHGASVEPALRSLLQRSLMGDRVDESVQARVLSPATFVRSRLAPEGAAPVDVDHTTDLLVRTTIPLFLGVLLLTALLSASGYLVQAVATDKESKIVEVLLSSVTPDEVLAGKLIGLGGAGLIQFAVWSSMVVFLGITASAAFSSMASMPWAAILVAPVLFVLGYLFLGSLMLATAALGANAAESQKLTVGWAMLAVLPLMVMVVLLDDPHGWLGSLMTWIPFTSPVTVILRLAVDPTGIAVWEVVGAILVLIASIWLSIRLGARLFRVGFLLTGTRPSLAELWRQSR